MTTEESGVDDLRCLFLPVPLSEIDVPERSPSFGEARGDGAAGWALPRQLCCLQAGATSTLLSPRQWFGHWGKRISWGKSLCLAGTVVQIPGFIRLQPVLLPLCTASTRQEHLPLPRELQQKRHNNPHVQTGENVVTGGNPSLRTLSLHKVFSFRHLISCLGIPIFEFMPINFYCSKATNDFDVFPLVCIYFFFWKAVKCCLIIFLLLEKPHKWQNSGGKLSLLIT